MLKCDVLLGGIYLQQGSSEAVASAAVSQVKSNVYAVWIQMELHKA